MKVIFLTVTQSIDCEYLIELHQWCGSNEYVFVSKETLGIFVSSHDNVMSSIPYYDTLHKLGSRHVSLTFLRFSQVSNS